MDHYYAILYGGRFDVQGTKKPHVDGVWLELFPEWK
jgi:hypothetical protein